MSHASQHFSAEYKWNSWSVGSDILNSHSLAIYGMFMVCLSIVVSCHLLLLS